MSLTKGHNRMIAGASVNVLDFGAVGDGVTDDTAAIQAAINTNAERIYFPQGTYLISKVYVDSNTSLYGDGQTSILSHKQDGDTVSGRMLQVNGLTGDQKENISISNLRLVGTVVADGFSEFRPLIYMYGVKNVLIDSCQFIGFQGDGFALVWTPTTEGNENVTVTNCVFDGVNNQNRNGISVLGCNKLTIENNVFKNITNATMPGAIDIEPNPGYGAFIVIDAVTIKNNSFTNIGGNVAAMSIYIPIPSEEFTTHPQNVTIENNTFDGVFKAINCTQLQSTNVTDSSPYFNLKVLNNKISNPTDRAFWFYGLRGVLFENNYVESPNGSRIGWSSANLGCNSVTIKDNVFNENGSSDGYVCLVYQSNRTNIIGNTFIECGVTAGGFGVIANFSTSLCDNVVFSENNTVNTLGRTTGTLTTSAGGSIGSVPTGFSINYGFVDTLNVGASISSGTGSPEGVKYAPVGSMYTDIAGGAGTTLYIKEAGGFATGWVAK